jgi:L-alanine-DL-glutamate epimerase-like enolase superfamily enzyme
MLMKISDVALSAPMLEAVSWRDACLNVPLPIENGYFVLPERPGLGFDVDERILHEHPGLLDPGERVYYV